MKTYEKFQWLMTISILLTIISSIFGEINSFNKNDVIFKLQLVTSIIALVMWIITIVYWARNAKIIRIKRLKGKIIWKK